MFTVAKSVLVSNNNTLIKNMESKKYSKVMFLLYLKDAKLTYAKSEKTYSFLKREKPRRSMM